MSKSSEQIELQLSLTCEGDESTNARLSLNASRTSATLLTGRTTPLLGWPTLTTGRHLWEYTIHESFHNWGDGMLIGVAEASEEGEAWGFCPLSGCVHSAPAVDQAGQAGVRLCKSMMGQAKGCNVTVTVDLDKGLLFFSINGRGDIEAGVKIASEIRPWVLLCYGGDSISIGEGVTLDRGKLPVAPSDANDREGEGEGEEEGDVEHLDGE
ncbi:MAG: hypothetical protein SGPRY_014221 [Prymnesium sp.]